MNNDKQPTSSSYGNLIGFFNRSSRPAPSVESKDSDKKIIYSPEEWPTLGSHSSRPPAYVWGPLPVTIDPRIEHANSVAREAAKIHDMFKHRNSPLKNINEKKRPDKFKTPEKITSVVSRRRWQNIRTEEPIVPTPTPFHVKLQTHEYYKSMNPEQLEQIIRSYHERRMVEDLRKIGREKKQPNYMSQCPSDLIDQFQGFLDLASAIALSQTCTSNQILRVIPDKKGLAQFFPHNMVVYASWNKRGRGEWFKGIVLNIHEPDTKIDKNGIGGLIVCFDANKRSVGESCGFIPFCQIGMCVSTNPDKLKALDFKTIPDIPSLDSLCYRPDSLLPMFVTPDGLYTENNGDTHKYTIPSCFLNISSLPPLAAIPVEHRVNLEGLYRVDHIPHAEEFEAKNGVAYDISNYDDGVRHHLERRRQMQFSEDLAFAMFLHSAEDPFIIPVGRHGPGCTCGP